MVALQEIGFARANEAADAQARFLEAWPTVEARLRKLIRLRGMDDRADDLVQEVALRVIEGDVPFESATDLYRWCAATCRNLTVDTYRRSRRETEESRVDIDAGIDVAALVEKRDLLDKVVVELRRLSPDDRELLIVTPTADRLTATRLAVRRHRLRRRILQRVGEATWAGVVLRRLRVLDEIVRPPALLEAVGMAVCAVGMAGGAVAGAAGMPPGGGETAGADRPPAVVAEASIDPTGDRGDTAEVASSPGTTGPQRAPSVLPDVADQSASLTDSPDSPAVRTRDRTTDDRPLCVARAPIFGSWCTP